MLADPARFLYIGAHSKSLDQFRVIPLHRRYAIVKDSLPDSFRDSFWQLPPTFLGIWSRGADRIVSISDESQSFWWFLIRSDQAPGMECCNAEGGRRGGGRWGIREREDWFTLGWRDCGRLLLLRPCLLWRGVGRPFPVAPSSRTEYVASHHSASSGHSGPARYSKLKRKRKKKKEKKRKEKRVKERKKERWKKNEKEKHIRKFIFPDNQMAFQCVLVNIK